MWKIVIPACDWRVFNSVLHTGLWSRSHRVGVGQIFSNGVGVEVGVGIFKKIGVEVGGGVRISEKLGVGVGIFQT